MTEFKGFDPQKNLGASFNPNRQGKGAQPEESAVPEEAAVTGDPYADLKMDPTHLMKLLAAQAKLNVPVEVENSGISQAVLKFATAITPERHARVSRIVEQAYTQEFGAPPSEEMLAEIVDDYLIGRVVIQNA